MRNLGMRREQRIKMSLIYLFLGLTLIFVLFPFIWMVLTSFKTNAEAMSIPPTWVPQKFTTASYIDMWVRKPFGIYFMNSTIIASCTAILSTILGGLAAYGFSRFIFKGKALILGIFLATQMLPGGLLIGPYFRMLSKVGLFNTRLGLIIAFITICLPFCTWMLKGFFDTVPKELDQAAMIDGCSALCGRISNRLAYVNGWFYYSKYASNNSISLITKIPCSRSHCRSCKGIKVSSSLTT